MSPPGGSLHAIASCATGGHCVTAGAPTPRRGARTMLCFTGHRPGGIPSTVGVAAVAVNVTVVSPPPPVRSLFLPAVTTSRRPRRRFPDRDDHTAGLLSQVNSAGQVQSLTTPKPINVIADVSAWFGQPDQLDGRARPLQRGRSVPPARHPQGAEQADGARKHCGIPGRRRLGNPGHWRHGCHAQRHICEALRDRLSRDLSGCLDRSPRPRPPNSRRTRRVPVA